jgi:hypothetical protein
MFMKVHLIVTAAAALLLAAESAHAGCADEIASLEQTLSGAGTSAGAAATETSEASPSAGTDSPTGSDPLSDMLGGAGSADASALASQVARTAGSEKVAGMIDQAKELLAAGKEAECMALIEQAKGMMGTLSQ